MEKEFVPYEEALAMKKLGFDETCLKGYCLNNPNSYLCDYPISDYDLDRLECDAPLYQQAFRWFRKVHNIHLLPVEMYPYIWSIDGYSETYSSFEEAELDCIRRLIEIATKKK